jgi:hypothetical protein
MARKAVARIDSPANQEFILRLACRPKTFRNILVSPILPSRARRAARRSSTAAKIRYRSVRHIRKPWELRITAAHAILPRQAKPARSHRQGLHHHPVGVASGDRGWFARLPAAVSNGQPSRNTRKISYWKPSSTSFQRSVDARPTDAGRLGDGQSARLTDLSDQRHPQPDRLIQRVIKLRTDRRGLRQSGNRARTNAEVLWRTWIVEEGLPLFAAAGRHRVVGGFLSLRREEAIRCAHRNQEHQSWREKTELGD